MGVLGGMSMNCIEENHTSEWTVTLPLKTVLLVYDQKDVHLALKWYLTSCGYVVDSVGSGDEAVEVFDPVIHDVVVTDSDLPGGMSGEALAQTIKVSCPKMPVVIYTEEPPAGRSSADSIVRRSLEVEDLRAELDRILA
jgi:two-component system, OmpR family, alkaline phosphatase synthesis response regulator PhoP